MSYSEAPPETMESAFGTTRCCAFTFELSVFDPKIKCFDHTIISERTERTEHWENS